MKFHFELELIFPRNSTGPITRAALKLSQKRARKHTHTRRRQTWVRRNDGPCIFKLKKTDSPTLVESSRGVVERGKESGRERGERDRRVRNDEAWPSSSGARAHAGEVMEVDACLLRSTDSN